MNAQADLKLCWAHMSEGKCSDVASPNYMYDVLFFFPAIFYCTWSTTSGADPSHTKRTILCESDSC